MSNNKEASILDLRELFTNCLAAKAAQEQATIEEVEFCVRVSEMFLQCLINPALRDFLFEEGKGNMN